MTPRNVRRASNRANARHSTGPRTPAGLERSAQNARRHGLTAAPDDTEVLRFYRLILGQPAAALPGLSYCGPREQAALRLAIAEAQLDRTQREERAHLKNLAEIALRKGARTADELLDDVTTSSAPDDESLAYLVSLCVGTPMLRCFAKLLRASNPNHPETLSRKTRTLRRYRREAEARRHKALQVWVHIGQEVTF
jgi:hypothetical protein